MRLRSSLTFLLLGLVGALGVLGWVKVIQQQKQLQLLEFTRQHADYLQAENTRLLGVVAEKQRAADLIEEHRQRGMIEQAVAGLTKLRFLHPVIYREILRSDLTSVLSQKLSQQLPDTEFDHVGLELSALGLIPAGMNLKKVYLDLLGEQIGAFYDQHTHELFTFSEHPLTHSQNQVILAHELTHALQDQHFDLNKLPLETRGNDDRALAASALVEGDATVVMNAYLAGNLSAAALRDHLAGALTTDVRQLAAAPRYLRETLLFPYLQGLQFTTALENQGGRAAIAQAFRDPPVSSSQIMHPEKYLATPREQPTEIVLADTTVLGTEPVVNNVLGEFTLEQVLESWTKDKAQSSSLAAGWRGDRILVYGTPAACSYVCRTAWRDGNAARSYCDAASKGLAIRYGSKPDSADALSFAAGGRQVRVVQAGAETTLIDAQDARWADALSRQFAHPASDPRL